jgi:hypothetical protein
MSYKTTDNVVESGYISKDKILEYVSQEDIFQLVFGFKPTEFEYITSPFREDNSPGCWFEIDLNTNKLRFTDFADARVIAGVKMTNIDCFDSVKVYYGLPSFYKTLEFIKAKLIDGKNVKNDIVHKIYIKPSTKVKKKPVKILMNTRDFYLVDKNFWETRYGITKQNLIDDKVFPIRKFKLFNTKTGDHLFKTEDIAYAYTEFESGNKKIYRPTKKGSNRFTTNCNADDVGGMHSKIKSGRLLIITKSYKDYRVLRNLGLNVRWLQNEGMFPKSKVFWDLLEGFDKVVVIFDNDSTGIISAEKLVTLINFPAGHKASSVHLPVELLQKNISDPSDLIHKRNQQELINFLTFKKILI